MDHHSCVVFILHLTSLGPVHKIVSGLCRCLNTLDTNGATVVEPEGRGAMALKLQVHLATLL